MALETYALDTLAATKAYLGVTDNRYDSQIEQLINAASQAIILETGREFAPAATAATRTVEYKLGSYVIELGPYEVRSVTAIVLNPAADDEVTLETGDWQLHPITTSTGVYDRIVLRRTLDVWPSDPFDKSYDFASVPAHVTGNWGWAAVPAKALEWVHRMVEDRFRSDVTIYADADGSVSSGGPVTVPYELREEMAQWRRIHIGAA